MSFKIKLVFIKNYNMKTIYGIMITGKFDKRMPLAIMAANNFFEQDYDNKVLIIINTSKIKIKDSIKNDNIKEYYIKQSKNIKLGDLRNIALSKLKTGDVWVQWDDDDFKYVEYVTNQYKTLINENADAVLLSGQLRFSTKKNTLWCVYDSSIHGSIMMYYDDKLKYKSVSTGEDTYFIDELINANKTIKHCNSIFYYLRIINDNNTWDDNHFHLDMLPENVVIIPNNRESEEFNLGVMHVINFFNKKIKTYFNDV